MTIDRINPPQLARPNGFSHAVVGHGTVVVLAGQTAMDPTGQIVGDDIVDQFEQALANVIVALRAAGGTPDSLAGVTIYTTDIDDYRRHARQIGRVWHRLIGADYPAMAGIEVSRLWDVEARVEIQAIAIID
jgi:enamine deaminase RidA (YjgF/YER057c/UK114 family)